MVARPSGEATPAKDSSAVIRFVPFLVALTVLTWIGATAATSQGQWGDHFEQFVWAHGVEWGTTSILRCRPGCSPRR